MLTYRPATSQNAIVQLSATADRKLEATENRRAALDVLFNSLLHHLMTGKLRVKDLDLALPEPVEVG